MIWHVRGCGRVRVATFLNGYRKLLGTFRDLMKTQLAPPVVNLHGLVFPFAHRHSALGGRIVPARSCHLIEAIVVPTTQSLLSVRSVSSRKISRCRRAVGAGR